MASKAEPSATEVEKPTTDTAEPKRPGYNQATGEFVA